MVFFRVAVLKRLYCRWMSRELCLVTTIFDHEKGMVKQNDSLDKVSKVQRSGVDAIKYHT